MTDQQARQLGDQIDEHLRQHGDTPEHRHSLLLLIAAAIALGKASESWRQELKVRAA